MPAKITFFPVDNGDMTLLEFQSGRKLLIDVRIRQLNGEDDDPPDVIEMLKKRLNKDDQGRHYVDGFLLSHPDEDHCLGLEEHFYLGKPEDYPKGSGKIFIREIWSSPLVFRRASKDHPLCDDAKAFNTEAKRRVQKFRDSGGKISDGDRIQILGEDENGKTNDLTAILVKVDEVITKLNGVTDGTFSARLLAPLPKSDDATEEETLSKNRSSTILRFSVKGDDVADACLYLTGGDAEVDIWERLWKKHKGRVAWLQYHMLLTPHHCSWHSLSHDSWSEKGEDAKVSQDARNALGQALSNASLIASSKPVKNDDDDPPCIRAKREYEDIADDANGEFICVMEHPSADEPAELEFEIGSGGPKRKGKTTKSGPIGPATFSIGSSGKPRETEKKGGGRYA